MRRIALLAVCAAAGILAGSPVAHAGPLGGVGGAIGGGFGGVIGAGALQGGFGGSVGGQVQLAPGQIIDPVTGRIRDARTAVRQTVQETRRTVPSVAASAVVAPLAATAGVPARTAGVNPIGGVVVASARPVVVYGADVNIDRRQQIAAFYAGGVTELAVPDAYVYMERQADELRRELAGTGVVVERQGDAIVLQLPGDVTFAFDKSDIRDRFFPVLGALAQTLNEYPATFVDVIGHTDAVGSVAYNQGLSERRAEAVADFIQRREAIPARLYVAGRGKSEPIATNATVQGRAENRRVEILLHPYTAG